MKTLYLLILSCLFLNSFAQDPCKYWQWKKIGNGKKGVSNTPVNMYLQQITEKNI